MSKDVTHERVEVLEQKVESLEQQVGFLAQKRPGRKPQPILVSKPGVCGIDPECDSKTCENASIYRFQMKCRGDACVKANRKYYAKYRKEKQPVAATVEIDEDANVAPDEA